jgi:isopropylmalate/homocitrate/citramalate synthase
VTIEYHPKVALCDLLSATGLRTIEAASFVSPKWVPQMASAAEVVYTRAVASLYLTPFSLMRRITKFIGTETDAAG